MIINTNYEIICIGNINISEPLQFLIIKLGIIGLDGATLQFATFKNWLLLMHKCRQCIIYFAQLAYSSHVNRRNTNTPIDVFDLKVFFLSVTTHEFTNKLHDIYFLS